MPKIPEGIYRSTFTSEIEGICIPPNEDAVFIQLVGDPDEQNFALFRDEVRRALSKLSVTVEYKDIYDRKMPIKQRSLKWFARHLSEEDAVKSKEKA